MLARATAMRGTAAKKGRKRDQTRRQCWPHPILFGTACPLPRLTPAGKRRGEKTTSRRIVAAFLVLGVRSSVGVTVNPLRDPLFYLMFATLFAVAFAATYLALA